MAKGDDYVHEIDRWHAARIARLTAPDGWLSLVGLEWLKPGVNRIGSAPDNDIAIAGAPAHLGTVEWTGAGELIVVVEHGKGVTIDGASATRAVLLDDSHPDRTVVAFGSAGFIAIDRGGRKGLRVRDSAARTRLHFTGIERFPVDPAWRIVADWRPLDPPFALATATVIGTVETYPAPGKATFTRGGRRVEVYPVMETPDATRLFLIFRDATSGRQTYGAARFLYADPPREGRIVLDFNKAYNPPCAFTAYATCPLAPPENLIDLAVTAGEKKPAGH